MSVELFSKQAKYGLRAYQGAGTTRICIPKYWETKVKHPGKESWVSAAVMRVLLMLKKPRMAGVPISQIGAQPFTGAIRPGCSPLA